MERLDDQSEDQLPACESGQGKVSKVGERLLLVQFPFVIVREMSHWRLIMTGGGRMMREIVESYETDGLALILEER